jgi:hypothetical protein
VYRYTVDRYYYSVLIMMQITEEQLHLRRCRHLTFEHKPAVESVGAGKVTQVLHSSILLYTVAQNVPVYHGLISYIDTKAKMSSSKKIDL